MLPTGEKLTVLGTNAATATPRCARDRCGGYVLTRQLVNKPVARERLAAAEAEVKALKAAPGELSSRLAKLREDHHAAELARPTGAGQADRGSRSRR